MNTRIKAFNNKAKENSILILPFALFFYLLRLSPMMYDGWAGPYYYINNGGLLGWIQYVFGPMRNWINGRVASNFFSGIIESFASEIPLDIIGALILTGILFCLLELFSVKNRVYPTLLYTALVILMPYSMRTYVIQIALIQYLTPVLFVLLALLLLNKYAQSKERKYMPYYYILCAVACTWMENTSVAYGIVITLFSLLFMIREKKIDYYLALGIIISLTSGLYMMFSPGMLLARGSYGGENSFIILSENIFINHLANFFYHTIYLAGMAHSEIAFVFFVRMLKELSKQKTSKEKVFIISLCFLNLAALFLFLRLCFASQEYLYTAEINTNVCIYIQDRSWLLIILLISYFVWLIFNVHIMLSGNKNTLFLWVYGISLFAVCLPTSMIAPRIIAPFYLIIIGIVSIAATNMTCNGTSFVKNTLSAMSIIICFIFATDYYSQLCNRIYEFRTTQSERIQWLKEAQFKGEWRPDTYYILPVANIRDLQNGGATTIGTFHYPSFLQRNNLDERTKILFTNNEAIILLNKMDNKGMTIQIIGNPLSEASYTYIAAYREPNTPDPYIDVIRETINTNDTFLVPAVNGTGHYKITVYRENAENDELQIIAEPLELFYNIGENAMLQTEDINDRGITVKIADKDFPDASYTYIVAYSEEQSPDAYVDIIKETNVLQKSFLIPAANGTGYYKITVYRENAYSGTLQLIGQPLEIDYNIGNDAKLQAELTADKEIMVQVTDESFPNATYTCIVAYCNDPSQEAYVDIMKETNISEKSFLVSAVNGEGFYQITVYREIIEKGALQAIGQPLEVFYELAPN